MNDATQTVEWVKKNIGQYGGDSDRLFLIGHSAGAQLAAILTLNERYLLADTWGSLHRFVELAGPHDFLLFTDEYQRVLFGPEKIIRHRNRSMSLPCCYSMETLTTQSGLSISKV